MARYAVDRLLREADLENSSDRAFKDQLLLARFELDRENLHRGERLQAVQGELTR